MAGKKIRKGPVLELAKEQSENAHQVVNAMKWHGSRTRWDPDSKEFASTTPEQRAKAARVALRHAERVARDADAILSHVRAWAIQEGALNV